MRPLCRRQMRRHVGAASSPAPQPSTTRKELSMEKRASVHWEGAGKTGKGQISTETGALSQFPYGFGSRFGDDRKGTNPEEILGAAHAACLTMALAFALEGAGFTATSIDTKAAVRLAKDGPGFKIDRIQLELEASIPGIDE